MDGVLVKKKKDIQLNYLKSWFFIDIASSFPAELFSGDDASQNALQLNKLLRLLRIFKLFRVFRIARIIKRMEDFVKVSYLSSEIRHTM